LEIAVHKLPAMQLAHQTSHVLDATAEKKSALGGGARGQASDEGVEVHGVLDLFSEQIALVAQPVTTTVQHGQRTRSRQESLAQTMAVDPGSQCRRTANQ